MMDLRQRLYDLIEWKWPELYAFDVHWMDESTAEVWMIGPGVKYYRWLACCSDAGNWTLSPRD